MLRCSALLPLALAACAAFADDRDEAAADLARAAAAPRPAPKWVELVEADKKDGRLAGYRAPAGLKVEVVADGLAGLHALAFLDDGTPLALERAALDEQPKLVDLTFDFRDKTRRVVRAVSRAKKDAVRAFAVGKDGWQKPRVVLEDEFPSALLPFDGALYVAGRGTVRRYARSKGDGPFDKEEVIARGFGGVGRHQVSGLSVGPDGWLYVCCGEADNDVEGSDGSRATVLGSGAVFRCKPDGSSLHVFARGFRNPHRDLAFDLRNLAFHLDDPAERYAGCRLLHVAEAGDYGWRTGRDGKADTRAAAYGERPGKLPVLLDAGKGTPAGLLVYNDAQLPDEYRNLLIHPDPVRRTVRAYVTEAKGSTCQVAEEFALLSAPKDEAFRPCHAVTGPDGAVYVADARDGKAGRVLRLSWAGKGDDPALEPRPADSWAKVAKLEDAKLIEALAEADASVRERARRELVKRGEKNRAGLLKYFGDAKSPTTAKMAAAGALQWMYDAAVERAFLIALDRDDDEVKRASAEALGLWARPGSARVQDALLKSTSDEDPHVRRAVALAMGRVAGPGAADGLATAFSFDDGKDAVLRDGMIRGLERLGKDGMTALIGLADSGVQKDTDRVVEAFLGMRSRAAFEALPTVLKHAHVSAAQRAELIRSAVNYRLEPAVTLEPVTAFVASRKTEPASVKAALLKALATPGVVGGKGSAEWAREMMQDESEELAELALAADDTPAGAAAGGEALLKRQKPSARLRDATRAALRRHEKDEAVGRVLRRLEGK